MRGAQGVPKEQAFFSWKVILLYIWVGQKSAVSLCYPLETELSEFSCARGPVPLTLGADTFIQSEHHRGAKHAMMAAESHNISRRLLLLFILSLPVAFFGAQLAPSRGQFGCCTGNITNRLEKGRNRQKWLTMPFRSHLSRSDVPF